MKSNGSGRLGLLVIFCECLRCPRYTNPDSCTRRNSAVWATSTGLAVGECSPILLKSMFYVERGGGEVGGETPNEGYVYMCAPSL